jgi:sugar lactone lactonase YvrE/pimeloyl-ACP methyl ester carboxylesterase
MKRTISYLLLSVVFCLIVAACGPTPTPEAANQEVASSVTEAAKAEPSATPTAEPTATPTTEPTAIPTIEPSATPTEEPATAPAGPEVVTSFDASRSELPEGIAIDSEGNTYVSLGPPLFAGGGFGEIWKIAPDGTRTTLAQFDGGPPAAGLAVDAGADLYYAYPSGDEATQGVYRLTPDGDSQRLPGSEAIALANGLAFDPSGNLYVGDSVPGAVWRIPPGGSAEVWLEHEWLQGCPPDNPFGANGVAFWEDALYAASTTKGLIVRIPILADGSPGEPEKIAGVDDCDEEFDNLDAMDGIALDSEGNIYALLVMQNKIVRIDPADGSFTTLLTGEQGLHNPASVVFGVGEDDQTSIFFTNYAVLPPVPPASPGPAVLKLDVGVQGALAVLPSAAAPTITPTPAPVIHQEAIEVAYKDRVIRGTLVGEGDIAVVLAPMWGHTRADWMGFARELSAAGYTAVAFDFPGAGASQGRASFSLLGPDTTAIVDLMLERGHEQVICMGASAGGDGCLGAAVARPNLAGFVVLSMEVEATEEEAASLLMPKLLVTGNEAGIIKSMNEFFPLLPEPKQYVKINTPRHGTLILGSDKGEELRSLLMTFLESIQ